MLSAQISLTYGLQGIHHLAAHGTHFARVRHAEDQRAAQRVAERGQFVRNPLAVRFVNAVAGEDDLLELDEAVLAERQLLQQSVGIPGHDRTHSCHSVHEKPDCARSRPSRVARSRSKRAGPTRRPYVGAVREPRPAGRRLHPSNDSTDHGRWLRDSAPGGSAASHPQLLDHPLPHLELLWLARCGERHLGD